MDRYVETSTLIRSKISKRKSRKANAGEHKWAAPVDTAIDATKDKKAPKAAEGGNWGHWRPPDDRRPRLGSIAGSALGLSAGLMRRRSPQVRHAESSDVWHVYCFLSASVASDANIAQRGLVGSLWPSSKTLTVPPSLSTSARRDGGLCFARRGLTTL